MYDPNLNTWSTVAPIPTARYSFAAAVCNGKVYVMGGRTANNQIAPVEEYNPQTNSWTVKAQMPTPRTGFQAHELNGAIYAVGGYDNSGSALLTVVEVFNPSTNVWSTSTPLPQPALFFGLAKAHDRLFLDGDIVSGSGVSEIILQYDPQNTTWYTKWSSTSSRRGVDAIAIANKIFVLGGISSGAILNSNTKITVLP